MRGRMGTRLAVVRRGFPRAEGRVGVEDRLANDRWISYSFVLRMRRQGDVVCGSSEWWARKGKDHGRVVVVGRVRRAASELADNDAEG
jgi:hypothetical protein